MKRPWSAKVKAEAMKAFLLGTFVVLLAFPVAALSSPGSICKIYINGEYIGAAQNEETAVKVCQTARLQKNSESETLTLLDAEITYESTVDYKIRAMKEEELVDAVYQVFDTLSREGKQLAYTVKINDCTITLESKEAVLDMLEQVQAPYDAENAFMVELSEYEERESDVMTVQVINPNISVNETALVTETGEEQAEAAQEQAAGALPLSEDGTVSVTFQENIEITESYVSAEQILDTATALNEITKQNEESEIYEVKAGDCLSTIADGYHLTTDELLALNTDLTVDSNILIGDEIVVTVPRPELSVVQQEQTTYTESYWADVQYIDDPNTYAGTNTVIQEAQQGERVVTALVEYVNGTEESREILQQEIIVEAVPKIIQRGTKIPPSYICPVSNGRFTSGFGQRWGRQHKGVDWGCSVGTTVRASRGGTVVSAGWSGGYGYCIVIDHGDGVQTRYAHLSKILVSVGQSVSQSDKIGLSGNTGNSTGPHLHFEVIVNGTPENPLNYLD